MAQENGGAEYRIAGFEPGAKRREQGPGCSVPPTTTAMAPTPWSAMPWPQPSRPPTKPAARPPAWPLPDLAS